MKKSIIIVFLLITLILIGTIITSCTPEKVTETRTVTTTTVGQNTTTTVIQTATVTSTQPVTTTQTVTTKHTVTTIPPLKAAGELASLGRIVYADSCYCHGPWEPDGKAEFGNMVWGYYQNALGLFDFNKGFMPVGKPGSLSDTEYLEVTAFMLVELEKIEPNSPFGFINLDGIPID